LTAIVVLSGCGGDDDSGGETTTPASAEANGDPGKTERQGRDASAQGSQPNSESPDSQQGQQGSNVPQPEGGAEQKITPQQRQQATKASIALESPAFQGGTALSARYTCDGENVSPPLSWPDVPGGTEELVIFVLNFLPVNEALFFDWAVAGLDPGLREIEEGKLPPGAVVGKNSFGKRGYALCPQEKGKEERYAFLIYAIPEALSPSPGFDPLELREAVIQQAGSAGVRIVPYKP
jgi:phosphatidylethanolamine-binding protein (PEBP) family uncharacterized protein